jgi:hypothetical protein
MARRAIVEYIAWHTGTLLHSTLSYRRPPNSNKETRSRSSLTKSSALSVKAEQPHDSNVRAQQFYERHGFIVQERTNGSGNQERAPDLRYVWLPLRLRTASADFRSGFCAPSNDPVHG